MKSKFFLKGKFKVPGDKSLSHRALFISSIAYGISYITNLNNGKDIDSSINALRLLGIKIDICNEYVKVYGNGFNFLSPQSSINLGNSGTLARFILGLVATSDVRISLIGDDSLVLRPMDRVLKPLIEIGAKSDKKELPISFIGTSKPKLIEHTLEYPSAQIKTALLFSALNIDGTSIIKEPIGTRDHTELMLEYYGANIYRNADIIKINGCNRLQAQNISIASDPSSAAFLVAASIMLENSNIVIEDVCINKFRTGFYDMIKKMGAKIIFQNIRSKYNELIADIYVEHSNLHSITVPANICPLMIDEYPIFSILASYASGSTLMTGLSELKVKESNRLKEIVEGLKKCKVRIEHGEDWILVHGTNNNIIGGCDIDTKNDHRISMSFRILNLVSKFSINVLDKETISTSFLEFNKIFDDIKV